MPIAHYRDLLARDGIEAVRHAWLQHPLMRLRTHDPAMHALLHAMVARYPGHDLAATTAPPGIAPDWRELTLPALVINGGDDTAPRRAAGAALVRTLGHATHALVPGAGHLPIWTTPPPTRISSGNSSRRMRRPTRLAPRPHHAATAFTSHRSHDDETEEDRSHFRQPAPCLLRTHDGERADRAGAGFEEATPVEIGTLPLYNEDLETASPPAAWTEFRNTVKAADAVLFVTPEYNRSMPGALKNALDVGSRPWGKSAWGGKPAAVVSITPGALGAMAANHHLRQVLYAVNLSAMPYPEAYIAGAAKLFDDNGRLVSKETRDFVTSFLAAFESFVAGFPAHS